MSTEEIQGSISFCLEMLKKGDQAAAQQLWQRYFHRLVSLARSRLRAVPRGSGDEEDVALSAFKSLLIRAEQGRFPQLDDRNDLWQLLYVLHRPESRRSVEARTAKRRGGGGVCYLSDLDGADSSGLSAPSRRPSSRARWPRRAGGCSTPWATRHYDVSPSGRWRATPTRKSPRNSGLSSRPSSASSADSRRLDREGDGMTQADRDETKGPPPPLTDRVDEACDRYEAAWVAGTHPRIEDYLPDTAGPERESYLRELLILELAYRRRDGEQPELRGIRGADFRSTCLRSGRSSAGRATAAEPRADRPCQGRTDRRRAHRSRPGPVDPGSDGRPAQGPRPSPSRNTTASSSAGRHRRTSSSPRRIRIFLGFTSSSSSIPRIAG